MDTWGLLLLMYRVLACVFKERRILFTFAEVLTAIKNMTERIRKYSMHMSKESISER